MEPSTSSDEEDLEKFREAAVDFVYNRSNKTKNNKELNFSNIPCQPPSLRPIKDDQEQFNLLEVTPGFQKFVAKYLDAYIQNQLQKKLVNDMQYKPKNKQEKTGVKLFSNSKNFISLEEENTQQLNRRKIKVKRRSVESDINHDVKIRLCAVNSEEILSKKGTEFWTAYREGEVYQYKRSKNGQLTYVEKEFK
ncbi:hypothetical protein Trydic_g18324 [Trypoxylus dichotomus]